MAGAKRAGRLNDCTACDDDWVGLHESPVLADLGNPGSGLAMAEFIKQNYSRVANAVTELVNTIHTSTVYASSAFAEYLTWHKRQVILAIVIIVICRVALAMWRFHLHAICIASNFHLAEAELNTFTVL